MKKIILTVIIVIGVNGLYAQPTPPANTYHGSGANTPGNGGGAPLDGGLGILIIMSFAWATKKVYQIKQIKVVD